LESGYVLEVELTEFADRLNEDCESKKGKVFALSSCKIGVTIYKDGKDWEEQIYREGSGI